MKARRIPKITKRALSMVLVLVLIIWAGTASADATLDEQLIEAANRGDLVQIKTLLKKGANIDGRDGLGRTALTEAAAQGDLEIVRLLLSKGVDVKANADSGWPALTKVAARGHVELARLLLDNGVPIDAKDRNGSTALMEAARQGVRGRTEILRLLLEMRADVNARDMRGWTALMWGVWYSHAEVVEILLGNDADVNAQDSEGKTPLMEAAARDHQMWSWYGLLSNILSGQFLTYGPRYPSGAEDTQIVRLLMDKGARVNAKDRNGSTALKRAQRRGHTEIVEILKAHGAPE
jgi:uncharacterized protein